MSANYYRRLAEQYEDIARRADNTLVRTANLAEAAKYHSLADSEERPPTSIPRIHGGRGVSPAEDERRAVLKRLQRLNPQGIGIGDPSYPTDVLKAVCDVLEGRVPLPRSAAQQRGDEGHRLGRVHEGMRYCTDRGCDWARGATDEEMNL